LDGLLGTSSPETGRFFSTKRGCKEIGFKDLSVAPGYTLLVGPTMRQILTASISKSDYLLYLPFQLFFHAQLGETAISCRRGIASIAISSLVDLPL
jgi:hypothetical protein